MERQGVFSLRGHREKPSRCIWMKLLTPKSSHETARSPRSTAQQREGEPPLDEKENQPTLKTPERIRHFSYLVPSISFPFSRSTPPSRSISHILSKSLPPSPVKGSGQLGEMAVVGGRRRPRVLPDLGTAFHGPFPFQWENQRGRVRLCHPPTISGALAAPGGRCCLWVSIRKI